MNDTTNRPAHWPSPDDPLLVAARALDAKVDGGAHLPDVVKDIGLNLDTVEHLVKQRIGRALRAQDIVTDPHEAMALLVAAAVDGVCIGWSAARMGAPYGLGEVAGSVEGEVQP